MRKLFKHAMTAAVGLTFAGSAVASSTAEGSSERSLEPRLALISYEDLAENDPILDDVYVKLYHARMLQVKARIGSRKANMDMLKSRLARADRLLTSNAISVEERELRFQEYEVAKYSLAQLESELKEAESMLNIAIDRISLGLSMPICPNIPSN